MFCVLELCGIFSSEYFWSEVGWIPGCETLGSGALTIFTQLSWTLPFTQKHTRECL